MKYLFFITRFFDWTPKDMEAYLKTLTPSNDGIWKDFCITSDLHKADYIVCWENAPKDFFNIHPEARTKHVFWFPEEPGVIRERTKYELYLLSSPLVHFISPTMFSDVPGFFNMWALYKETGTYTYLQQLPLMIRKRSCIVAITSGDRNTEGQIQRTEFLKRFCHKYPSIIQVYGRRWDGSQGPNGKRAHADDLNGCYRGEITGPPGPVHMWKGYDGKYDIYMQYHYALVLENVQQRSWITEKIVDALLAWCFPFYWGCPNISDYLPINSFEIIDITNPYCIDYIASEVEAHISKEHIDALTEARKLLLSKYHPLEIITSGINAMKQKEAI